MAKQALEAHPMLDHLDQLNTSILTTSANTGHM
jgi:hypothetical protein